MSDILDLTARLNQTAKDYLTLYEVDQAVPWGISEILIRRGFRDVAMCPSCHYFDFHHSKSCELMAAYAEIMALATTDSYFANVRCNLDTPGGNENEIWKV